MMNVSVICVYVLLLDFSFPVCIFNIEYESEGAICEWIAILLFFGLFALFAAEFRHIDCCKLTVQKSALNTDDCPVSVEKNNYAL